MKALITFVEETDNKQPNKINLAALQAAEQGDYQAVALAEFETAVGRPMKTIVQTSRFKQGLKRI